MRSTRFAVMAVVVGLALVACAGDEDGDTGDGAGTTRLSGTLVGPAGESGVLEVVIEADAATLSGALLGFEAGAEAGADAGVAATGTITWLDGGTVSLSGTAIAVALQLSGEGYSLAGTWRDGGMTGTYVGPNGTGSFAAGLAAEVRVYCGTYAQEGGDGETGTWNVVVSGDEMIGLARSDDGESTGQLSGTLAADGSFTLNDGDAQGRISGDEVSGTYDSGTSRGSFTGSRCD